MRLFVFLAFAAGLLGTAPAVQAQASPTEAQAVQRTITTFFDGMRRGDSTLVRSTLAPVAVFHAFGAKTSGILFIWSMHWLIIRNKTKSEHI